jgi:DNA invertase Pin-like site-specific DNA recombinase
MKSKQKQTSRDDRSAPKKVAIYGRVSSKRQAEEEDSLEAQERLGKRFVEDRKLLHGWQVEHVRCYFDKGKSGKNMKRPELDRLRRDIANGEIDYVVTTNLNRLTRSFRDYVELWGDFKRHGVEVISIRESFDTSTPAGEAMVAILMAIEESLTPEPSQE